MTTATVRSKIGMVSLVCLVIGNMIGSGVYISSSYALGALEDARLVLVAWAIGGVHAICGAVAYAALARRIRISGGEYAFLSRLVHPSIGFMAGWISLVAGFTAPIATAALVFGEYVCASPQATPIARTVATVWILACAVFHWVDLRTGSWVNNGIVLLKFIGFSIFAVACAAFLNGWSAGGVGVGGVVSGDGGVAFVPALDRSLWATDYWSTLASGGVLTAILVQLFFISLSYTGFNASIYIAEEVDEPEGSVAEKPLAGQGNGDTAMPLGAMALPSSSLVARSMVIACVLVTLIYLGLNFLFLACDTRESIQAGQDYFVSNVAKRVGGEPLQWVMRITIALSSATSVLAMLATGPRVYAQMARDGWLPRWFGADAVVPRNAIVVQAILSSVIVWMASVLQLISYLGITLTACGALATSTLWIAYREMASRKPIAWWEHAALCVYILGAVLLLVAAYMIKPVPFWLCVGTFASGLVVYIAARWLRRG